MPENDDNPLSFFRELKRRKVIRVIIVYAAAAFAILELVSIIAEPFGLPDWTIKFVFVILCVGLIISIILSWIYDIHPEEGIVKTEPAHKVKQEEVQKPSNSWKIASYISFVVIIGLIIVNVVPRSGSRKALEKSIAVLPLEYLSEDPDKEYLANGVLDAITGHLSLIEGLRVMPRTSVEQYRENKKSAKDIGKELEVSYLIEGSFLMIEDQVRLTIQLVAAEEGDHVFFKEYDRNYKDIIAVQGEVAETIAKEIEVAITPEEKQRIEKIPTSDLTAYDFYLKGMEELEMYWSDNNIEALGKAEDYFYEALGYDSTFALAYIGLAKVYRNKNFARTYFSENFLDSVLILTDKALAFDPQLSEAYVVKGNYYRANNNIEQAINEYEKAIKYNPNDWEAYARISLLYSIRIDWIKAIENGYKALALYRGPMRSEMFRGLGNYFAQTGFKEKAYYFFEKAFKLDNDSAVYLSNLSSTESMSGNLRKSVEYAERSYAIDSTESGIIYLLGLEYSNLGQYDKSLKYFTKIEKKDTLAQINFGNIIRIGYAYLMNGNKEKAEDYFKRGLEAYNKKIELGRLGEINTYAHIAAYYSIKRDKEKALKYLRLYSQGESTPIWVVKDLKYESLFDNIREELEYQQILRDVEAKYQAEHERVRHWLEENNML